jgi:hypothetical protein
MRSLAAAGLAAALLSAAPPVSDAGREDFLRNAAAKSVKPAGASP